MILMIPFCEITSLEDYFRNHPEIDTSKIKYLRCDHNNLTSLTGCPSHIVDIDCSHNKLENFEGCPVNVVQLNYSHNYLTSLRGCPPNVKKLNCSFNLLESLQECPASVVQLVCDHNFLESLKGCPSHIDGKNFIWDWNPLKSFMYDPFISDYGNKLWNYDYNWLYDHYSESLSDTTSKQAIKNTVLGNSFIFLMRCARKGVKF